MWTDMLTVAVPQHVCLFVCLFVRSFIFVCSFVLFLDLDQEFAEMKDLGLPTMFINQYADVEEEEEVSMGVVMGVVID
jgi:hypothetical protein